MSLSALAGAERLWPRAAPPPRGDIYRDGPIELFYAEHQDAAPPPAPAKLDFESIAAEIGRADPAQLRRLRRHCALLSHPDRAAPEARSEAEAFLARVNAAIDSAIARKSL